MVDPMDETASTTDIDDDVEAEAAVRPPMWSVLPSWRGTAAWLMLTVVTVALDGWTGFLVSVGIAAALLVGVRPRTLTAAGVVCAGLVPVWILSRGSVTTEDVTPALVVESLIPHHLAFSALVLLVVSVALQTGWVPLADVSVEQPRRAAGPLGAAGPVVRWGVTAIAVVLAVVVCVVAWQT